MVGAVARRQPPVREIAPSRNKILAVLAVLAVERIRLLWQVGALPDLRNAVGMDDVRWAVVSADVGTSRVRSEPCSRVLEAACRVPMRGDGGRPDVVRRRGCLQVPLGSVAWMRCRQVLSTPMNKALTLPPKSGSRGRAVAGPASCRSTGDAWRHRVALAARPVACRACTGFAGGAPSWPVRALAAARRVPAPTCRACDGPFE